MIATRSGRAKELAEIKEVKKKHKQVKEYPVRIDSKTVIMVPEGRDPVEAANNFREKQKFYAKRDFNNNSIF